MKKIVLTVILTALFIGNLSAQKLLTLENCTQLALGEDRQLKIDIESEAAATDLRKAAFASFFPKVSANGMYMWNQKNVVLIPNELTTKLGTFNAGDSYFTPSREGIIEHLFPELTEKGKEILGGAYKDLRDKLTFDIHNVFVAQVGVTQPIYLGGRLTNLYKMSQSAEKIAQMKSKGDKENTIIKVTETYLLTVSLQEKVKLAEQYTDLLKKLLENVEAAVEEGVATKSDILKVRVKLNEAELLKSKAENALATAKMTLCKMCGLPLNADVTLDASKIDSYSLITDVTSIDSTAVKNRSEIKILEETEKMTQSAVKLSSAGLQPNIIAAANYVASSPNVLDGFNNRMLGGFNVGVVVNIPIAHADAIYRYKAAKHSANVARLELEDATKAFTVEASQTAFKVQEGNKNLKQAILNLENADENLRLAQEAYNEGVATVTDVMIAQTGWQTAYDQKIDAAIGLRSNELLLKKQLGKLSVE